MTNEANKWVKKRIPALKRELGAKCSHRGCGERRLSHLRFEHIKETPISRTGARGRKEKCADVAKHPDAYKLKCWKHAVRDKETVKHDALMRKKGARKK